MIVVRLETKRRLEGTCLRGPDKALAGNFRAFRTLEELFAHEPLLTGLLNDVCEAFPERANYDSYSVDVDARQPIGWESTLDDWRVEPGDLEVFEPEKGSTAQRIKPGTLEPCAPLTSYVTFEYRIVREQHQIAVIIDSIYPGVDRGELYGDITKREGRVFFPKDHPGEVP